MWVFYHKNQGHTIWYYISVIFKAVFGDLQVGSILRAMKRCLSFRLKGFFTSLIYFYFNTEIRHEVLRQVHRTILTNDSIRRSSAGDTLSTRLSTFRRSISRYRHSSVQNRGDRRRTNTSYPSRTLKKATHEVWWKKCLAFICPCLIKDLSKPDDHPDAQQQTAEQNNFNDTSPAVVPEVVLDDELAGVSSPLIVQIGSSKGAIDNDGLTCDTELVKNDRDDEELWSDDNDVTVQNSSLFGELPSNDGSVSIPLNSLRRNRSNSEGLALKYKTSDYFDDSQSVR